MRWLRYGRSIPLYKLSHSVVCYAAPTIMPKTLLPRALVNLGNRVGQQGFVAIEQLVPHALVRNDDHKGRYCPMTVVTREVRIIVAAADTAPLANNYQVGVEVELAQASEDGLVAR